MKEMIEPELLKILEQNIATGKWKTYEGYKDSGIEWLGEIPEHWKIIRLKHTILGCQNGIWGDEPTHDEKDMVCVRVADFDRLNHRVSNQNLTIRSIPLSQRQNRVLKQGDLLIEKSGGGDLQPVGTIVLYDLKTPAVCSNFIARMQVGEGYDAPFLCYLHNTLYEMRINTLFIKQNTGIQNLDSTAYISQKIALPVFLEQKAITAFLDRETAKINDLIAKKERMIELLQERRTAIINRAITKGLNPDVPMKDSGVEWLGKIPAHWEVMRLKFIADVLPGVAKGRNLNERKVIDLPYLRVANVQDGHLELSDVHTITVGIDEVERYSLKRGDVLMNEGGDFDKLGRGFIWDDSIKPCLHQNHVFAVRPFRVAESVWINIITQTSYAKHYFILKSKQSTNLASISKSNIEDLPIIIPPAEEMEHILKYISSRTARIDKIVSVIGEAIKKLKEYNTALISAAVTGKIDVRGEIAETQAEETAL